MRKLLCFLVIISLTLVFCISDISLNQKPQTLISDLELQKLTDNWSTDKVIGRYSDPNTGETLYKSIFVSDIIQLSYKTDIIGENKIIIKYQADINLGVEYKKLQEMEFVQPDYVRAICENNSSNADINSPISWGTSRAGGDVLSKLLEEKEEEIVVAVVDSGVDLDHEFLKHRLIPGYDIVDGDEIPEDENGHGTHVAGIVTDSTPSNIKIMPIRVMGSNGRGHDSDIGNGIYYAVKNGADIINLSLGGIGYSPCIDYYIEYALENDVLVVAAAGNDSLPTDYYFPAGKEEIIVVSSISKYDDLSSFSNYGDTIDLCAPGEEIYSSIPDNTFSNSNGTSMAAPLVSAIAAMIKLEDSSRTIDEIEAILKTYTDDIGDEGWDKAFGEGVINVSKYVDEDTKFEIISPSNNIDCWNKLTVKYYTKDHIGDTITFYLGDEEILSKPIDKDGYQKEVLDLKNYEGGEYQLKAELIENETVVASRDLIINFENYNTSFQVLDIVKGIVKDPHIALYGIKDDYSKNIHFEGTLRSDGTIFTNLDMESLLKEYDYVYAITSGEHFNRNLAVPIYVRNIVSTGKKVFEPKSLQKVTIKDNMTISDSNAYLDIIPFINNHSIQLMFPIGKYISISKYDNSDYVLWVDNGNHKLRLITNQYSYLFPLIGSGENTIDIDKANLSHVNLKGEEVLKDVNYDDYAELRFYKIDDVSTDLGALYLTSENEDFYLPNGSYKVSYHRNQYNDIMNFYKYISVDNPQQELDLQFGGKITNEFILDYSNNNLDFIASLKDSYDNRAEIEFWIPSDSMAAVNGNIVLESLADGTSYNPEFKYTYWERLSRANSENFGEIYTFSNHQIPDGDYKLYIRSDMTVPIYETDFQEKLVKIESGKFVLGKSNNSPTIARELSTLTVEKYEKLELDLLEIFDDIEGDKLYFESNIGYIVNNKFNLINSTPGIREVQITAKDFKGGTTTLNFKVVVLSGEIIIDDNSDESFISNIENVSDWALEEILNALGNGIVSSGSLTDLQKSITREEFCELIVKFYEVGSGKECAPSVNNPFIDTNNETVLKAYNLGIISGNSSNTFGPNHYLTREEMCVIICRTLEAIDDELITEISPDISFKDEHLISDWAKKYVLFCSYHNIMNGAGDNTINPKGMLSKEQAIILLNRGFNKFIK